MTNPAEQNSRRKRLRLIEEMILDGRKTGEIFDLVGEKYGITYGTLRNDIVDINKAHKEDIDKATEFKGRSEYLARTRLLRRKAMAGIPELDAQGQATGKIKDRNLALVAEMDRAIARLHGVDLKSDSAILQVNLTTARNEMDRVMMAVFSVITDEDTQDLIIKAIESLADENLQIEAT